MSLSSYIKRQSRVARRSRAMSIVGLGLASIVEDPEPAIDLTSNSSVEQDSPVKSTKKNSMKAKRRLGVSDLAIPRTSALFTAVQGVDDDAHAEWRLRLSLSDDSGNSKDDTESFDFPRPPMLDLPSEESESSLSSSGSSFSGSSNSSDSLPTTPTPSPTLESYAAAEAQGQCVIRCKSIKPLTITKRAVSPVPPPVPVSVPVASTSTLPQSDVEDVMDEEDMLDDYYYASHARTYITLSPPLPPSFPRRESAIIPTMPMRASPPPPIITHSPLSSSTTITRRLATRTSRPPPRTPPSRPPPRTPLPTDAVRLSGASYDSADFGEEYVDYVAYTPLLDSRGPSPEATSSSAARLAALLSPPPHTPAAHSPSPSTPHTPATPAPYHAVAVPRDVSADEWDSGDDEFVYGAAYDEDAIFDEYAENREEYNDVPLSPLMEPEEEVAVSDVPTPAPYTGWHPRPRASQLRLAVLPILTGASGARTPSPSRTRYSHAHGDSESSWVTSHSPTPSLSSPSAPSSLPFASAQEREPEPATPEPQTPALRSRWSSSTLSSVPSVRSPHAAASPRTFGFARRYFPRVKASTSPSTSASSSRVGAKEKGKPRPMGAASVFPSTPSPKPSPAKPKGKGIGGKKGLTAANVRRVLPPSLLLPPSLSMSNAIRDHAAYTPYMAKAGDDTWIGTRPSAPSVLACTSPDVFASYSGSASSPYTPSPGFSGQRGSKRWSYASAPGDGGEEADDEGRRKPIPVEMFLR
ncbi:hypothetical protein C8F04DRAFT_1101575, partial [Mycena alexandri]